MNYYWLKPVGSTSLRRAIREAGRFSGDQGESMRLSWWEPDKRKAATYLGWANSDPGKSPEKRIYLQISNGDSGNKLVYLRFESE